MNQQLVINKFIERCGELEPIPEKHFIQNKSSGRFGLTTELGKVLQGMKFNGIKTLSPSDVLPEYHFDDGKNTYDWFNSDLLKAMRLLQNSPFSKITVISSSEPTKPLAFTRRDCNVSVLLAPLVLEKKGPAFLIPNNKVNQRTKWFNPDRDKWKLEANLPNCTFQLWTFDCVANGYGPNTVLAYTEGYPIGKLIKCSKCGVELGVDSWIRKLQQNHPECICSCDTYDDFCGCRRMRDRIVAEKEERSKQKRIHLIKRQWGYA